MKKLADDVERFEVAAGALLGELGYPLAFDHPGSVAVEHSRQLRNLLANMPKDVRPYRLA